LLDTNLVYLSLIQQKLSLTVAPAFSGHRSVPRDDKWTVKPTITLSRISWYNIFNFVHMIYMP